MNIIEIYTRYNIHLPLQLHQLRVGAVAKLICDNIPNYNLTTTVVSASLLHDIGNLTKSIIEPQTDWVQELGYEYWVTAKARFITQWGENDHDATINIVKDINPPPAITQFIKKWLDTRSDQALIDKDLDLLIAKYADERVNPDGIVSLADRIKYLALRYPSKYADPTYQDQLLEQRKNIENFISGFCALNLTEINDELALPVIERLKSFEL